MAETLKVLGQSAPVATTNTDIYTVPASKAAVISTLMVCNRDTAAGTFRIAVRPGGAAIANQHYLFYDTTLGANSSTAITIGITLAANDVVTVYASSAVFSFSLFGSEVDV